MCTNLNFHTLLVLPFYIPTSKVGRFQFLHILINICQFFKNYIHLYGCEVVSHCGLNLHFPNDEWASSLSILSCVHWQFAYLWRDVCSTSMPFLHWVVFLLLSCKNSLYVLNSTLLADTWCANIIFCTLLLLDTALCSRKVWSFDEVQFICFFVTCGFVVISNNSFPNPKP